MSKTSQTVSKLLVATLIGGLCLLLTVLLSGAAFASPRLQTTQGQAPLQATTPTPTMPMNQMMSQPSTVQLTHATQGVAQLALKQGTLTVTLSLSGLAPNSTHVAHIHQGKRGCLAMGNDPVIFPLKPITAAANGQGSSTTTLTGIQSIPASGWYINVHNNGNGLRLADQIAVIACGNVQNPHHAPGVILNLGPSSSPNENASGTVKMTLSQDATGDGQKRLDVSIMLKGLAPGSTHAAHIHMGSCQNPGDMLYTFGDLTADHTGKITVTEQIPVGALQMIPATGWIVNVHYGPSASLTTQTGYTPVLCGPVVPAKA